MSDRDRALDGCTRIALALSDLSVTRVDPRQIRVCDDCGLSAIAVGMARVSVLIVKFQHFPQQIIGDGKLVAVKVDQTLRPNCARQMLDSNGKNILKVPGRE